MRDQIMSAHTHVFFDEWITELIDLRDFKMFLPQYYMRACIISNECTYVVCFIE